MFPITVSLFWSHGTSVLILKPEELKKRVCVCERWWGGKSQHMKKAPSLSSSRGQNNALQSAEPCWITQRAQHPYQWNAVPQIKICAGLTFRAQTKPFLACFPSQWMCLFWFFMKRAFLISLWHMRWRGSVLIEIPWAAWTCECSSGRVFSSVTGFRQSSEKPVTEKLYPWRTFVLARPPNQLPVCPYVHALIFYKIRKVT